MIAGKTFSFLGPRIDFEAGGVKKIGRKIKALGGKKVFICTDSGVVGAGLLKDLTAGLETDGYPYIIYDKVQPNPLMALVEAGSALFKQEACDLVIAIGGGSSMDTAKVIAMLGSNPEPLAKYCGGARPSAPPRPLIAVPTTAGTGSEVTSGAVVTDPVKKLKISLIGFWALPSLALLDPSLLKTLPARAVAEPGLDALTHAVESYISLFSTPITEALSLQAIRLMGQYLRKFYANPADIEAAGQQLLAGTMAGLAFNNALVGMAHDLAHSVGGCYNLGHGLSCGLALPHVMEFCRPAVPEKLGHIAAALGEKTDGLTVMAAADLAIEAVKSLNQDLGLPERFSMLGVKEEDVPDLAKKALDYGFHKASPRRVDYSAMEKVLRAAL